MARPADLYLLVGSWKMGGIAYVYDWQERSYDPPRMLPWTASLHFPDSTSFISVSIFSVCCYSRVSISMVRPNRRDFFVILWCTLNSLQVSLNLKYRKFKDDLCFIFFGGNCVCVMFVLDGGCIKLQVKWRLGPNSIKLSTHVPMCKYSIFLRIYSTCTYSIQEHRSLRHTFWAVFYACRVANCHKCCITRKNVAQYFGACTINQKVWTVKLLTLKRDGWLSRWRASLLRQYSGFESRHPSKIINGRHKRRSGRHTLARQKNIKKTLKKFKHCCRLCPNWQQTETGCYFLVCFLSNTASLSIAGCILPVLAGQDSAKSTWGFPLNLQNFTMVRPIMSTPVQWMSCFAIPRAII